MFNPLIQSLEYLKPKFSEDLIRKFNKLNIFLIEDLLLYTPRKYLNFTQITNIDQIVNQKDKTPINLKAVLIKKKTSYIPRKRLSLLDLTFQDETGTLKIPLFNQKFLSDSLIEGQLYSITCSAKPNTKYLITSPSFELISDKKPLLHSHRLLPIYPETKKLTSKMIRFKINKALEQFPMIPEIFPEFIISGANLSSIKKTIESIHYPKNIDDIKLAKYNISFIQIFFIQLYLQKQKMEFRSKYAPLISFHEKDIQKFIKKLPYKLTKAQEKSIWEIIKDMESQTPMNRLLEGDVGTGKTLVAIIIMFNVFLSQKQSAFMAPTEILATQHFESLLDFFQDKKLKNRPTIALLTSKESRISLEPELGNWITIKKPDLLKKLALGKIDMIIGTHSLISDKVIYSDLALTIVDEQHRFGVKQRAELQNAITKTKDKSSKTISHLLSMTATPIPRTLALSLYGDLDISLLDEYPIGRKTIKTKLVKNSERIHAYHFIRKHIESGRQIFVICPKIESDEKSDVKSIQEVYDDLTNNIFPEFKIEMLHGKMKTDKKDKIMQDFKNHNFDILVSTSVIEVGVNIPNASIIVIEGAERFGLAQLHQFRGRVGRGEYQSFCFLFDTNEDKSPMNERLSSLEKATNGFELAELDLKLRGPGQFIGNNQSGMADISMIALTDTYLINLAKNLAKKVLQLDNSLTNFPYLKWKLSHFQEIVHFE